MQPTSILVVGDSHASPEIPNDRYTWLGRAIADLKPDVVVDIGDWADMPSLSKYDKHRRSGEGKRYVDDVDAARNARRRVKDELDSHNRYLRKETEYHPRLIALDGNHEDRVSRAANEDPSLYGKLRIEDLGAEDYGWERHGFLELVDIAGIYFSHYFTSGIMGRPIGGKNPASRILDLQYVSCVQGHAHTYDYCTRTRADGQHIFALVAGCYFEHDHVWAGPSNKLYWRGLVMIDNIANGYGDVKQYGMNWIKKTYG